MFVVLSSAGTRVLSREVKSEDGKTPRQGPLHRFSDIIPLLECPKGSRPSPEFKDSSISKRVCIVDGTDEIVYPRPRGLKPFVLYEESLPKEVNIRYPSWYRGNAQGFEADETSHHYYYDLIGEGLKAPGYDSDNIYCASFFLQPGKTYFAHNHPTREMYYFFDGEGTWYGAGDEYKVQPGTFIVNPPYISHGVKNTSTNRELKALACWWKMPDDPVDLFNNRGLPLDPCAVKKEETSVGYETPAICTNK